MRVPAASDPLRLRSPVPNTSRVADHIADAVLSPTRGGPPLLYFLKGLIGLRGSSDMACRSIIHKLLRPSPPAARAAATHIKACRLLASPTSPPPSISPRNHILTLRHSSTMSAVPSNLLADNVTFYDQFAATYDDQPNAAEFAKRNLARLRKMYPHFDPATTTVLDFACGTGKSVRSTFTTLVETMRVQGEFPSSCCPTQRRSSAWTSAPQ